MNLEGVRVGGLSEVGVTVPESGHASEGVWEDSPREEKTPDRIAIPSVPVRDVREVGEIQKQLQWHWEDEMTGKMGKRLPQPRIVNVLFGLPFERVESCPRGPSVAMAKECGEL